MKLALIATLILTPTAQAAVLDMVPLGNDVNGRNYSVERNFYSYGSEDIGYKYKGTRVLVSDQYSRQTQNYEIYFDCSDDTFGYSVPTSEDVVSGTMIHAMYQIACPEPVKTPVNTKPLPIGIRPLN